MVNSPFINVFDSKSLGKKLPAKRSWTTLLPVLIYQRLSSYTMLHGNLLVALKLELCQRHTVAFIFLTLGCKTWVKFDPDQTIFQIFSRAISFIFPFFFNSSSSLFFRNSDTCYNFILYHLHMTSIFEISPH